MNARSQGTELLSVRIGALDYAIDIMAVREIRGWIAATSLPHAPRFVRGLINLRGVVLAVIDLGERLGFEPTATGPSSVVVVIQDGNRMIGLLVDAVSDILTVTDDMIQANPGMGRQAEDDFVQGLVTIENRIVSILSLSKVVPERELLAA